MSYKPQNPNDPPNAAPENGEEFCAAQYDGICTLRKGKEYHYTDYHIARGNGYDISRWPYSATEVTPERIDKFFTAIYNGPKFDYRYVFGPTGLGTTGREKPREISTTFSEIIASQIDELLVDLDDTWVAKVELLQAPKDLSTYKDAFASAAKNCKHYNYTEILYRREYICLDCNKYLKYNQIPKGMWGF